MVKWLAYSTVLARKVWSSCDKTLYMSLYNFLSYWRYHQAPLKMAIFKDHG